MEPLMMELVSLYKKEETRAGSLSLSLSLSCVNLAKLYNCEK